MPVTVRIRGISVSQLDSQLGHRLGQNWQDSDSGQVGDLRYMASANHLPGDGKERPGFVHLVAAGPWQDEVVPLSWLDRSISTVGSTSHNK